MKAQCGGDIEPLIINHDPRKWAQTCTGSGGQTTGGRGDGQSEGERGDGEESAENSAERLRAQEILKQLQVHSGSIREVCLVL